MVDNKDYFVATDRFDLSAEEIALAYKLRWDIEIFFGWWKQHLNVYHLIARINRVRELRIKIKNELAEMSDEPDELNSDGLVATTNGPPSHASP